MRTCFNIPYSEFVKIFLTALTLPLLMFVAVFVSGSLGFLFAITSTILWLFLLFPLLFIAAYFIKDNKFFTSRTAVGILLLSYVLWIILFFTAIFLKGTLEIQDKEIFLKSFEPSVVEIYEYKNKNGIFPKKISTDVNTTYYKVVNNGKDFVFSAKKNNGEVYSYRSDLSENKVFSNSNWLEENVD